MSSPVQTSGDPAAAALAEQLALWLLRRLEIDCQEKRPGVYRIPLDPEMRAALGPGSHVDFTCDLDLTVLNGQDVQHLAPESRVVSWLIDSARDKGLIVLCRPQGQPSGVHDLAQRLLDAYTVDEGHIHLAGCQVEDRVYLSACLLADESEDSAVCSSLVAANLNEDLTPPLLSPQREQLQPLEQPAVGSGVIWSSLLRGLTRLSETAEHSPGGAMLDWDRLSELRLVWFRYARGKLRFTIGRGSEDVTFSDWSLTVQAPPFVCPHTGRETMHVAATDDGRLTANEEIETCQQSGQRVLGSELVQCSQTGRRVLKDLIARCPVSDEPLLPECLTACMRCHELVSPASLKSSTCTACRSLERITKADPRMALVLDEHPGLDRWRRWKLAETATVYILQARSLLKRLFLVLDKETAQPKHIALRGGLRGTWRTVEPEQYEDWLL